MNQTPKISLIMSVYNGEDYLEEAIDSVLKQSFTDWELIVINDCSTDRTPEILSRYAAQDTRVHVHTNEVNLRLPSSLNKAMSLAKGKREDELREVMSWFINHWQFVFHL